MKIYKISGFPPTFPVFGGDLKSVTVMAPNEPEAILMCRDWALKEGMLLPYEQIDWAVELIGDCTKGMVIDFHEWIYNY